MVCAGPSAWNAVPHSVHLLLILQDCPLGSRGSCPAAFALAFLAPASPVTGSEAVAFQYPMCLSHQSRSDLGPLHCPAEDMQVDSQRWLGPDLPPSDLSLCSFLQGPFPALLRSCPSSRPGSRIPSYMKSSLTPRLSVSLSCRFPQ